MKGLDRCGGIICGICLALLAMGLTIIWSLRMPTLQARAARLTAPKPVELWYVCKDLGYGSASGMTAARQRLKLCHDSGWEVYTYCTQPGLPVPRVGRRCTRLSEDTYQCGARNQLLREYRILKIPADTPVPIAAQVISTATPTLAATPIPTQPVPTTTTLIPQSVEQATQGSSKLIRALLAVAIGVLVLLVLLVIWMVWDMLKRERY